MEFEKLKKIIAEVLNVDPDEITMETTFQDDLGADSLDVYQIIMGIEEEFDIEIPAETAEQVTYSRRRCRDDQERSELVKLRAMQRQNRNCDRELAHKALFLFFSLYNRNLM